MKTNDFKVGKRCFHVLAAIEPGEWVSCQYVVAAAMFPPEKLSRAKKGSSTIAAQALRDLSNLGLVAKRKKSGSRKCEYQLTEKGWQVAKDRV
jgi:RIO-like serine/threonine protein kinase